MAIKVAVVQFAASFGFECDQYHCHEYLPGCEGGFIEIHMKLCSAPCDGDPKGRSPHICTVRDSVTCKKHILFPLRYNQIHNICLKYIYHFNTTLI